jgi:hypothetical protein
VFDEQFLVADKRAIEYGLRSIGNAAHFHYLPPRFSRRVQIPLDGIPGFGSLQH